jgi:hypothetical protein
LKSLNEMQQLAFRTVGYQAVRNVAGRPSQFTLRGELGYRLERAISRLEHELPYCHEYILGQVQPLANYWTNFPRYHGDVAGRWILALTYAYAGQTPPEHLATLVTELLALQNDDGSFGYVQTSDEPLNVHRAYGNGWLLKALAQYAITFGDDRVKSAATALGDFYENSFDSWHKAALHEADSPFYAATVSCYFHGFDGLMTLYDLTKDGRYLTLASQFIPFLTPLKAANHSHMYLTIRRGLLRYYLTTADRMAIDQLASELDAFYQQHVLETGGIPERLQREGEHIDDEGCSLFDWLILTTHLYEATQDTRWLERAIYNLENHIYYNQTYNGGFGHCALGQVYRQEIKEAPWCCSLFGPYGLMEAGSLWVRKDKDCLEINHLVSGDFTFDGETVGLEYNLTKSSLIITTEASPSLTQVALFCPFWLSASAEGGYRQGERLIAPVHASKRTQVHLDFKLWTAAPKTAPRQVTPRAKEAVILFYGPWLLGHRFHSGDAPVKFPTPGVTAELAIDQNGFVTNGCVSPLLGAGFYGEGFRLRLPADLTIHAADPFRGLAERSGELYLHPLKIKESPSQQSTQLYWRPTGD